MKTIEDLFHSIMYQMFKLNKRKIFYDMPIKNEEETYLQIFEMGRNNDYTTGNLLDYQYFSKH